MRAKQSVVAVAGFILATTVFAGCGSSANTTGDQAQQDAAAANAETIGGNTAPTKTLSGNNTGLNDPFGVAFDSDNNMYIVNSTNSVTVYGS